MKSILYAFPWPSWKWHLRDGCQLYMVAARHKFLKEPMDQLNAILALFDELLPGGKITQLRQAIVFLESEGRCLSEIAAKTGMTPAAVGRNAKTLSGKNPRSTQDRITTPLITLESDPSDDRLKLVRLTHEGRSFRDLIKGAMEPISPSATISKEEMREIIKSELQSERQPQPTHVGGAWSPV